MLFLKLLQSIISTLNSEGTPRQIAAGFALGAEVAKVQAKASAKVESLVGQQVAAARAKLASLQTDVQNRIGVQQQQQLQDVQAQLEGRLQELGQVIPGVRLPGLPRIRP